MSKSKKGDSYKLTELQANYVKAKIKHPKKKQKEIMTDIGHPNTDINEKRVVSNMIQNQDPRLALWEKHIGFEKLCKVAADGMEAMRYTKLGSYEDHQTRIKAAEYAAKLGGVYSEGDTTNVLIISAVEDIKKTIGWVDI